MALFAAIEKQLGDFRLQVEFETEGETMGLLGASGSGKSLTLQCIAGIETPDRGRIVLNGRTLFDSERGVNLRPQQRRVGYLFQQYALFPNLTVAENLETGLHRLPRSARAAAVREALRTFQLERLANLRPRALSGGQQQRVALARLLGSKPELLLLDEPFSALDSNLHWQMELELSETMEQFPGDILLVSHNRDEICHLCRTVSVLRDGRSEKKRPVRQLFEAPDTLSAAQLSGCRNYARLRREGPRRIFCADWGVSLETDEAVPETAEYAGMTELYICPAETRNAIFCRVVRVFQDVSSVILVLATPGGNRDGSLLRMELPRAAWAALGEPDRISVAPGKLLLLTGAE